MTLQVPLSLEQLPTPKEFKDAIASLSPEQQRFAKMYRAMQVGSPAPLHRSLRTPLFAPLPPPRCLLPSFASLPSHRLRRQDGPLQAYSLADVGKTAPPGTIEVAGGGAGENARGRANAPRLIKEIGRRLRPQEASRQVSPTFLLT